MKSIFLENRGHRQRPISWKTNRGLPGVCQFLSVALLHLRGAQERTVAGGAGLLRAEDLGLPAEDHPAMLHLLQVGKLKCEVCR